MSKAYNAKKNWYKLERKDWPGKSFHLLLTQNEANGKRALGFKCTLDPNYSPPRTELQIQQRELLIQSTTKKDRKDKR